MPHPLGTVRKPRHLRRIRDVRRPHAVRRGDPVAGVRGEAVADEGSGNQGIEVPFRRQGVVDLSQRVDPERRHRVRQEGNVPGQKRSEAGHAA